MSLESQKISNVKGWNLDPFEELQRVWNAISDGARLGVPHVVGRATVRDGVVSGLELSVILHEAENEYSFRDGDDIYFMVPAKPEEGIEGVYIRINRQLSDAR